MQDLEATLEILNILYHDKLNFSRSLPTLLQKYCAIRSSGSAYITAALKKSASLLLQYFTPPPKTNNPLERGGCIFVI